MLGIPVVWTALAVLACAVFGFGTGWHYGGKNAKADCALMAQKAAQAAEALRKDIDTKDAAAALLQADLAAARAARRTVVTREVIRHAQTLPDPPACALDDARVRAINAAFGLDTNTGGQPAAVPAAQPARVRLPQ